MSKIFYKNVESALRSLNDSTRLTVSLRNETIVFTGRNSPYISHQGVEVKGGHNIPRLAVLSSPNHSLALSPEFHGDYRFGGSFKQGLVPAYHFKPLFQFPLAPPDWITGLVRVTILDLFDGFEEGGEPRFKPYGKVYVEQKDGWSGPLISAADLREQVGVWKIHIPAKTLWQDGIEIPFGQEFCPHGSSSQLEELDNYLHDHGFTVDSCNAVKCIRPDVPGCKDCPHNLEASGLQVILPTEGD